MQAFTSEEVRERVYQMVPKVADVLICCFRHTAGALRRGSTEARAAILVDPDVLAKLENCE